jgi:hypothetical protein
MARYPLTSAFQRRRVPPRDIRAHELVDTIADALYAHDIEAETRQAHAHEPLVSVRARADAYQASAWASALVIGALLRPDHPNPEGARLLKGVLDALNRKDNPNRTGKG